MRESRLDRCIMVFVLCLGILLLLLQVASSPSGQHVPASIVALSTVGAMGAITVGTIRSRASGWNKRTVKVVGVLFVLVAVWLFIDSPRDLRTALLDTALAVVLLASGRKTAPAALASPDG